MIYVFGDCELDTRRCELRRGGARRHVEPQVFDVLRHLIEHRDRLVPANELLDTIWGHRFVAPATLNSRIKAARQAVGDDGAAQRLIRTVRGRGFRFVAEVAAGAPGGAAEPSGAAEPGAGLPETYPVRTAEPPGGPAAAAAPWIRLCRGADGVRIAYATSGSGPPLVKTANWLTHLTHDWDSPVWRHWLRELSRDHTLVRYDARGCGLSDWNAADLSFDAWVRDLELIVDALGLERVPLFGLSQGCAVAVAYAVRRPERVSRLVLYGGYALGRRKRARTEAELREAEALERIMPLGWGRENPAFRQFFAALFLPEGTPEQMQWFSDLQRLTTSPETAVRLRTASGEIDVTELAPGVRAPTLVLHATGDAVAPLEQGCLLASLIPGARLVPLESRNHILLETEPAWAHLLEEVRPFLQADG